jgi:hypothetical protein
MPADLYDLSDLDDLGDLDDLEDIGLDVLPAPRSYDAYPRTEELECM